MGRAASAPRSGRVRLGGGELCGKRAAATPTDAAPSPRGARRAAPDAQLPARVRARPWRPAASPGRRPAPSPAAPLPPRGARPPPPTSVAAFLSLTETPGRAAGPGTRRPSPGPRVRASVRARAALTGAGAASAMAPRCPARPGAAAAAAAGPTQAGPQALRRRRAPGPASPPCSRGRRARPARGARGGRGRSGRAGGGVGAGRAAVRAPGRLRPGRELGPGPQHRPPARARPLCGRGCDPGSGPGPGCELRCRPGASSAGELHSSCHVDTNCILGGMSLSGRLKRNTPRLVGGCRNPDSSIYSR